MPLIKRPEKLGCSSGYALALLLLVLLRTLGCVKGQCQQSKHDYGYNDGSGIHDELKLSETTKKANRPLVHRFCLAKLMERVKPVLLQLLQSAMETHLLPIVWCTQPLQEVCR